MRCPDLPAEKDLNVISSSMVTPASVCLVCVPSIYSYRGMHPTETGKRVLEKQGA
jgi:hypothetical protein